MAVRQQFGDIGLLLQWLRSTTGLSFSADKVQVSQFSHGQSNPTYVLRCGDQTPVVVRKQPSGALLKGAHDVGREYALATALRQKGVPAPKALGYCEDVNVVGTKFWCYEYVAGRHFKDAYLEEAAISERPELILSAAQTAALLHSCEPPAELVTRLGGKKQGSYLERQVRTWTKQYVSADEKLGAPTTKAEEVSTALMRAVFEAGDCVNEGDVLCVAHGDLRCDNMIYEKDSCRVAAVLDWELGTIGHPASDLAYLCMPYDIPPLPAGPMSGYAGLDLERHGIPTRSNLEKAYVNALSRPAVADVVHRAIPHLDLFGAIAYFRLASIVRGVYARAKLGNAAASNAAFVGSLAHSLLDVSAGLERRHRRIGGQRRTISTHAGEEIRRRVRNFVDAKIIPLEAELLERSYCGGGFGAKWVVAPELENLKAEAKHEGLWNLFLLSPEHTQDHPGPYQLATPEYPGGGLTSLEEYASICEEMGRSILAAECFNCSAPDTGNMEVLAQFGTPEQKVKWLRPLLEGQIRSCYAMTEPAVASSDPTNLRASIRDVGDGTIVVSGRKWWTSGANDPRCAVCIFMGRAEGLPGDTPKHARHSMVLVPMDKVHIERSLRVFGFDDAPHGHSEIVLNDVVLDKQSAIIAGHGDAFRIAQARLGPGRVHHCMRAVGACERALDLTKARVKSRIAFGQPIAEAGTVRADLARARISIDQARLLVHHCAKVIDTLGNKAARKHIAMIKVAVPNIACHVLDSLMQMWGGAGLSTDTPLAHMYAQARTLRQADGPDEVHLETIAKLELKGGD